MLIKKLEEKIIKAEAKMKRCESTLIRKKQQLEHLMKAGYASSDATKKKKQEIINAKNKLQTAVIFLKKQEIKLANEKEKVVFIEHNRIPAIESFLEEWKKNQVEWYINAHIRYVAFSESLGAARKEIEKEYAEKKRAFENEKDEKFITKEEFLSERALSKSDVREAKKRLAFDITVVQMALIKDENERLEWLDKALEFEKIQIQYDLIHRVFKIVGNIIDAGNLSINKKGNLDGYVQGVRSIVKVETVGAGGHNVQSFHFRTLVHAV